MKKILLTLFIGLFFSSLVFSQNKLPDLEKVRKIKIFESTQKDVQKILAEYLEKDSDEDVFSYWLRADGNYIMVSFSEGDCGEDEYWNVPKGLVTGVSISNISEVKVKDLGFNLKAFKKEIEDKDYPKDINYHDEKKGIFIKTENGDVEEIVFYPPKSKKGFLCSNENTLKILSGKERLVDTVTVIACILLNMPAVINDVVLSETEVFAKRDKIEISVRVNATDVENDVLSYIYKVSGGKINGKGANVIWDLSDVKPGTYTITVGVDDGAGIESEMKIKTVIIN